MKEIEDIRLNFKNLLDALRHHRPSDNHADSSQMMIQESMRHRLAMLLDIDPNTPFEDILVQLTDKWKQDGLI